jgi:hypothetical protein
MRYTNFSLAQNIGQSTSSVLDRLALMHQGDGVSGDEEQTINSGERFWEGFGVVEIEQHSVFPIAPPGFHLPEVTGRVDNLNGVHSVKLGNNFAPGTPCRAQNQDPRFALALFLNRHVGILLS